MNASNRKGESAAARAYRAIEGKIVTLELAPGATLTEGMLIELVGFGRTPVREAIQRLSWEGLVEVRPRAGILVAPIQPGDWIKVLAVRAGLEPLLARSAVRFGSNEALEQMRQAAVAMQAAVAACDVHEFLAADKMFDEGLADAADNPYAVRVAQPLQSHSRRFWFRYRGETGLADAAAHHIALIEAIVARDPDSAFARAGRMIELLEGYARELI